MSRLVMTSYKNRQVTLQKPSNVMQRSGRQLAIQQLATAIQQQQYQHYMRKTNFILQHTVPVDIEEVAVDIEEVAVDIEEVAVDIEEVPQVIEEVPPVIEEVPQVIEEVPPVIEEVPQVIEEVPPVIEEVPPVIEEVPHVIEEVPHVIEEVPQVIEEVPPVIQEPDNREIIESNNAYTDLLNINTNEIQQNTLPIKNKKNKFNTDKIKTIEDIDKQKPFKVSRKNIIEKALSTLITKFMISRQ